MAERRGRGERCRSPPPPPISPPSLSWALLLLPFLLLVLGLLVVEGEVAVGEEGAEVRRMGTFWEALVEGFRSWVGEGERFREADWRVEARVMAGVEDILERLRGEAVERRG